MLGTGLSARSLALRLVLPLVTLLGIAFSSYSDAVEIIAHRGASGYLPEHTLESTTLAYAQQPDYIEQDVVLSKDNIPVVLHDIHLETVTNVEQLFKERARQDGRYYAIDFTLAELRQLRVHERQNARQEAVFPQRYQGNRAQFGIATLAEHSELITQLNRQTRQQIGLYTEIKSPAWHRAQGVDISRIVLAEMKRLNLLEGTIPLVIQCFDFTETQRIRRELGYTGMLVQLVADNSWHESDTDYDWLLSEEGLEAVAEVADGVGPWIPQLADTSTERVLWQLSPWVANAKKHNLLIHPYTFRADELPAGVTAPALIRFLVEEARVDGIFTDQVPPVKALLANPEG
ncbi:glycerophosphodiester phosphodiesterase [Salinimonas sediminis]|uniref:glycerophosphodiester phosphodiesterase n=1 Tax=Salinimonas sediminis TaxID=2303538 RepID=A0A346NK09_9ALTE|nr:glycerophosphodiester phosphodiesterase [Salinimonas sediminis]AXR05866.1 glycerophosphodiester phosphodiesterase [Salinimonas sediminis]